MAKDLDFSADLDSTDPHPDPHPSAPSDAPNRTYTAKEVADHWGTSDSNIRNKWINKLLDAYWWLSENDFKTGDRFNAFALDKFGELQRAVSPKIPKLNHSGEILRSSTGRPLLTANPHRIGLQAYKDWVAQFAPVELEDDSDSEADGGALVPTAAGELVSPDLLDAQETALADIDDIGTSISDAFAGIDAAGAAVGNAIAARFASQMSKSTAEGVATAMAAVSQSLGAAAQPASQPPPDQQPAKKSRRRRTK